MPEDHVMYTDHIVKPTKPLQIAKTFDNYKKNRDFIYGIWQHKVHSVKKVISG